MPAEGNKQAVRRFYQDVINGRNLDALEELLAPDGVDHTFGSQRPEQARQFLAWSSRPSRICGSRSTR